MNRTSTRARGAFVSIGLIAVALGLVLGAVTRGQNVIVAGLIALGCIALMMPFYVASNRERLTVLIIATFVTAAISTINIAYFVVGGLSALTFIWYRNSQTK